MKRVFALWVFVLFAPFSNAPGAQNVESYTPSHWASLKVPSDHLTREQTKDFGLVGYAIARTLTLEAVTPEKIGVSAADLKARSFTFPIIIAYKVNALEAKKLEREYAKNPKGPHPGEYSISVQAPNGKRWNKTASGNDFMENRNSEVWAVMDEPPPAPEQPDEELAKIAYGNIKVANLVKLFPKEEFVPGVYEIEVRISGKSGRVKTEIFVSR